MRAVGGDEVQFDPASRTRQPGLDQFRVMVSGIIQSAFGQRELTRPNAVQKDVDCPDAGILCLDRHQQHDRTQGVDRQHIFHDGLTGLKVDGAMNIQTMTSTALFDSDGRLFRRPAAHRPYSMGRMHRIREDHDLIGR